MLVRSVLYMHPRRGRRDDLVNTFERLNIPQAALAHGCISVELQVAPGEDDPVLVTALWTDADAYDRWLVSPVREQTRDEIMSLLISPPEGTAYAIRIAAGASVVVA